MIEEAIILAGGFGTRLSRVVKDVPKPMADVAGRPFLAILIDYLSQQGIKSVVLCTGYKHEIIQSYFNDVYATPYGKLVKISYSQETEPLGTGGAAVRALSMTASSDCLLVNGDTFFKIPLQSLHKTHMASGAVLTMALRNVPNASRYGSVLLSADGKIENIAEKSAGNKPGLINGGVYIVSKTLLNLSLPQGAFSFEKEVLEKYGNREAFFGQVFDDYFLDIGIEQDYFLAQTQIPLVMSDTLFLDRDGVINKRIAGSYVMQPAQFEFLPKVKKAVAELSRIYNHIFIVTNQRGISKGLFTENQLELVHEYMQTEIKAAGGRIDRIYYCPDGEGSPNRKPAPGMAYMAKQDFQDIAFEYALMVGDSSSDIEFAKNAGIFPIYVGDDNDGESFGALCSFASLWDFAEAVCGLHKF